MLGRSSAHLPKSSTYLSWEPCERVITEVPEDLLLFLSTSLLIGFTLSTTTLFVAIITLEYLSLYTNV